MTVREVVPPSIPMRCWPARSSPTPFALKSAIDDLDARRAAERMMARQPRWAEALLSLRNLLVAPLGLKTSGAGLVAPRDMIGIFPVVSRNAGTPRSPASTIVIWIFASSSM